MLNLFLKPIVAIYLAWVHRLERKIGYRLEFTNIPESWINGWMIFDITKSWKKHKINALGVDYFTLGHLVNGLSSRFIRTEKEYQSWLGAYLVKFNENKEFTLQDHFDLAVADQKNWLKDFGDPKPYIKMSANDETEIADIKVDSYKGKLYEFLSAPSDSDVGQKSNNSHSRTEMAIMAGVMNASNLKLHLKSENFIPKNTTLNYETIILKGYIAIIELEKNIKVVLYGNGAVVDNKDYYELLKQDILKAFKAIKILKLK